MIQGHVFTALLKPDGLPSGIMRWHERLHGLTAPAFMFGAGLAFGSATYGSYRQHRNLAAPLARRLRWYLWLLVLGYMLQAPGGSLWAALHAQGAQLASVTRVGPLQLVALALCTSQLLILLLPTRSAHAIVNTVLGAAATLLASPVARAIAPQPGSGFWAALLEDRGGAHFQPLPWAGFVWLGVSCAGWFFHWPSQRGRGPLLFAAGALCTVLAYNQYHSGAGTTDPAWLWRTSPSYFLFRLGCVVMLLGALHALPERGPVRRGSATAALAQHSLLAYVVHLLLLHGTPWTPDLAHDLRRMLTLEQAVMVTLALLAITFLALIAWARLRAAIRAPRSPIASVERADPVVT